MPHVGNVGRMERTPCIPLLKRPTALVVEPNGFVVDGLTEELVSNGWSVETCSGPERARCPMSTGGRCALRERADAAVVFFGSQVSPSRVVSPRVRCAASGCGTAVAVLEKSFDQPRIEGSFATIGSLRGPAAIRETLQTLSEGETS